MSQQVSPGTGSNGLFFFYPYSVVFVQTQRLWPWFSSWAFDFLFWSCIKIAWTYFYLCVTDECIFYIFLGKERRYLLLDRLINVHSPELTAKSIRTGQCPGKVKTSSSQYARNKAIRHFYASIFIRFGHVFVEKKCKNVLKTLS